MTQPPDDFGGNIQDWRAIEDLNSKAHYKMVCRSIQKLFEGGAPEKAKSLPDGEILNLACYEMDYEQDEKYYKNYDMGWDNKLNNYVWKNEGWIRADK